MSVTAATGARRRFRFEGRKRLNRPLDFQRVFRRATREGDRLFTVLARRNDAGLPRLGLAISARSAGTAVARNRVKRAVREVFRAQQDQLDGLDIVVMGRPGVGRISRARMRASLERLFRSISKKCARP